MASFTDELEDALQRTPCVQERREKGYELVMESGDQFLYTFVARSANFEGPALNADIHCILSHVHRLCFYLRHCFAAVTPAPAAEAVHGKDD